MYQKPQCRPRARETIRQSLANYRASIEIYNAQCEWLRAERVEASDSAAVVELDARIQMREHTMMRLIVRSKRRIGCFETRWGANSVVF